jgi:hypothetical protein
MAMQTVNASSFPWVSHRFIEVFACLNAIMRDAIFAAYYYSAKEMER